MSTTHLVYDTGTISVPPGFGLTQIGPNLDVRKYSKIRVIGNEIPPPAGVIVIDLVVNEGGVGGVSVPLALGLVFPFPPFDAVFDVPGRELQIFVRDIPPPVPAKLRLLVFGLEL